MGAFVSGLRVALGSRVPSCRIPRRESSTISAPPVMMHESARLNTGQCGSSRKSMTRPRNRPGLRKTRSVKLPRAPPSTRPRATAHQALRSTRATRKIATMTAAATRLSTTVRPDAAPNAAPELRTSRSLRTPSTTSTGSDADSLSTARCLVAMSSVSTTTATTSTRASRGRPGRGSLSDAPRAACMSCTESPGGRLAGVPCRSGCHSSHRCHRCHCRCGREPVPLA